MIAEHLILARGSAVDRDTQSLSIFEMIEHIQVQSPKFPVLLPVHAIVVVRREEEEKGAIKGVYRLRVENPAGEEILKQDIEVRFEESHMRQRLRMNFPLSVASEGPYYISLEKVGDPGDFREVPIDIRISQNQQTPTIN